MHSICFMKYLLFNDAREGIVYTLLRKQFYILNINLIFLFYFIFLTNGENFKSFAFHENKGQAASRKI